MLLHCNLRVLQLPVLYHDVNARLIKTDAEWNWQSFVSGKRVQLNGVHGVYLQSFCCRCPCAPALGKMCSLLALQVGSTGQNGQRLVFV